MGRYDEWRSKVSDILSENLTRTLMLPLPPAENSKIERYLVNFTTDLSDTLAEVKHLEHLGNLDLLHFTYLLECGMAF